ncbi:hypothetical protein [Deefgea piscis]|uniref:hypothetical protein n=1 Tax=Deefgea piscis TaxID=2739061 RepID=UPI001C8273F0|nr:hypothetical protein [Deefgea piscis]QZA82562.1 hypothetical protein K4H25_08005 [Deefgea piscis]
MNENDVQVGAMVSIPRYLEEKHSPIKWSASFPYANQQNDTKADKVSGDLIAKFDISAIVLIEFKRKNGNSIAIKEYQKDSVRNYNYEPYIYSRVAFNLNDHFKSDEYKLGFQRSEECLKEIIALTQEEFDERKKTGNLFTYDENLTLRKLIDDLLSDNRTVQPSTLMETLFSHCHADELDNFALWMVSNKKLHTLDAKNTQMLLAFINSAEFKDEKLQIEKKIFEIREAKTIAAKRIQKESLNKDEIELLKEVVETAVNSAELDILYKIIKIFILMASTNQANQESNLDAISPNQEIATIKKSKP